MNEIKDLSQEDIQHRIYTVRGVQVMLDRDLAPLYHISTGQLNQAVKRNIGRIPEDFMFQLAKEEWESLKSHFVISKRGGDRSLPYAFTSEPVSRTSARNGSLWTSSLSILLMTSLLDYSGKAEMLWRITGCKSIRKRKSPVSFLHYVFANSLICSDLGVTIIAATTATTATTTATAADDRTRWPHCRWLPSAVNRQADAIRKYASNSYTRESLACIRSFLCLLRLPAGTYSVACVRCQASRSCDLHILDLNIALGFSLGNVFLLTLTNHGCSYNG